MEYELKNGKQVLIRKPCAQDAEALVRIMKAADSETRFLGRNPGEFNVTAEQEAAMIEAMLRDEGGRMWLVPEYEGKIVGQCSVGLVRNNERFLHRASVAFLVLKAYWGLGIGGKMMQECLAWCKEHEIEQVELDVLQQNERAVAMYQSFGFEIVGAVPHALKYPDGTYGDEYLMIKRL